MMSLLDRFEAWVRALGAACHDLAGRPFAWLILRSRISPWLRRTEPNAWSLVRLPLALIICLLMIGRFDALAAVVFLLALLTDRLDGELARLTNQITPFGKALDTFVDATMMSAILLGLAARLPTVGTPIGSVQVVYVFVGLEAMRLIGGWLLQSVSQTPAERLALEPNLSGKYKMPVAGLGVLAGLAHWPAIAQVILGAAVVLSVSSLLRHVRDWLAARFRRPI